MNQLSLINAIRNKNVVSVVKRNTFIRICKNCKVEQKPGSTSKKCWKCAKPVNEVKL